MKWFSSFRKRKPLSSTITEQRNSVTKKPTGCQAIINKNGVVAKATKNAVYSVEQNYDILTSSNPDLKSFYNTNNSATGYVSCNDEFHVQRFSKPSKTYTQLFSSEGNTSDDMFPNATCSLNKCNTWSTKSYIDNLHYQEKIAILKDLLLQLEIKCLCPHCQVYLNPIKSMVVAKTKRRSTHIRTNPWISDPRNQSTNSIVDRYEQQMQPAQMSFTDSGIFEDGLVSSMSCSRDQLKSDEDISTDYPTLDNSRDSTLTKQSGRQTNKSSVNKVKKKITNSDQTRITTIKKELPVAAITEPEKLIKPTTTKSCDKLSSNSETCTPRSLPRFSKFSDHFQPFSPRKAKERNNLSNVKQMSQKRRVTTEIKLLSEGENNNIGTNHVCTETEHEELQNRTPVNNNSNINNYDNNSDKIFRPISLIKDSCANNVIQVTNLYNNRLQAKAHNYYNLEPDVILKSPIQSCYANYKSNENPSTQYNMYKEQQLLGSSWDSNSTKNNQMLRATLDKCSRQLDEQLDLLQEKYHTLLRLKFIEKRSLMLTNEDDQTMVI